MGGRVALLETPMSITLKNSHLEVSVRPECGGRIDQITDLSRGKPWLWHPPGYDPGAGRELPAQASFDACWQGGFEEMFPNDAACTVDGVALPDHGEAWSAAWSADSDRANALTLTMDCERVPIRLEKQLVLDPDAPVLNLRYRMTNLGDSALPCMLKLHPALAIEEGDQIELPRCNVEAVALGFSRLIGQAGTTRWPTAVDTDGETVRLDRTLPAASEAREFVYCSRLEEGRCGVRNARTGSTLQFSFDRTAFPFVWVFQSYGGFNGHYVLMLEPCTSKPYDLLEAIAQDTAFWLAADTMRTLALRISVL